MKVKLTKTGGLMGVRMSAESDWDIDEQDWKELVSAIEKKEVPTSQRKKRDAFHHSLQKGDDPKSRVPVNISKVPEKYAHLFKPLFEKMKAEG